MGGEQGSVKGREVNFTLVIPAWAGSSAGLRTHNSA
jgi:hypothetical protein